MKTKIFFILLIITSLIIGACNPLTPVNFDTAEVTINTGVKLAAPGSKGVSDVTSFTLTVSADDMATIEQSFTDETISLELAAGLNRTFTLKALDSAGNALFSGTSTVNLVAGEEVVVVITMETDGFLVAFDSNGGGSVATQYVEAGALITEPTIPVLTNFSFNGWYSDAGLTTPWDFALSTVSDDITLYADWFADGYSITYNLDGGTNDAGNPDTYTILTPTILFAAPSRTGYSFVNWCSDAGLTTPISGITIGSTGDVELYADWDVETYTITYNLNGGVDPMNPSSYTIETPDIILIDPTRASWDFAGWYTEATFENQITEIALGSTGNMNLHAKWTNSYFGTLDTSDTSLTKGASYNADYWEIVFGSTVNVTVSLLSSYDNWLYLYANPATLPALESNDDYDGLNAGFTYEFSAGVTYYIEVTTYNTGITGAYELQLTEAASTMSLLTGLPPQ